MAATSPPLSSLALLLFLASFLLFLLLVLLSLHLKAQHKSNKAREAQRSSHTPPEAACGVGEGEEEESERRKGEEKKRKKRGRKKRQGGEEAKDGAAAVAAAAEKTAEGGDTRRREAAVGCPFPLSSFGSAMQRRIKSQYDELVKSSHAKVLTIAQVYKLEAEHKRLKEDAAVYNLVQEQLKLSPAYKTMLEISASMEKVPTERTAELPDISFEELLAQEKKDSFWQRNGKLRSFPS